MSQPSTSQAPLDFAASELFFSTTNSRGVIEKANGVFVRLSQYTWEQLVGAPHNVIRHPAMPGAAFKLMWQTLQAGEPFCAYVVNRAASGAPYTVFATITPLGDGYLSVRSRPCALELQETAFSLYQQTRRVERAELDAGAGAPAAATVGLETLAGLVQQAGLADYDAFIEAVLPAEVAARAAQAGELAKREGEGPLFDLLGHVRTMGSELSDWEMHLDKLAELTKSLQSGAAELRSAMEASAVTAEQVTSQAGEGAAPIMLAVNLWASMLPEIEQAIDELRARLTELAKSSSRTRMHIALAHLHNAAIDQFAVELIDTVHGDEEGEGSGVAAITDLARAVDEGLARTARRAQLNAELAQQVAVDIEAVHELLLVPQGLLGNWQEMAGQRQDDAATALVPVMAQQMADGDRASVTLAELAERCRSQAEPLDISHLEHDLSEVRRLAHELVGQQADAPTAPPRRGA